MYSYADKGQRMTDREKQNAYVPKIQYKKFNPSMIGDDYNLLFPAKKDEKEVKDQKLESFKQRLSKFKSVSTLEEAKVLLDKTMPISLDRTTFYIGEAKVVIINYDKRLRICLNSPKEFICYDFV